MDTHTIYDVVENTYKPFDGTPEQSVWLVHFHRGDTGQLWVNGFPHALLANLVAEYEFDPNDVDTLVDFALHQNHMTIQHTDANFVYHVPAAAARTQHLWRLKRSKQIREYVDPYNLLPTIKSKYDPNDPQIAIHYARVNSIREQHLKVARR